MICRRREWRCWRPCGANDANRRDGAADSAIQSGEDERSISGGLLSGNRIDAGDGECRDALGSFRRDDSSRCPLDRRTPRGCSRRGPRTQPRPGLALLVE